MKQLLQTLDNHTIIVGLSDRAYLVGRTGGKEDTSCVVCELLPASASHNSSPQQQTAEKSESIGNDQESSSKNKGNNGNGLPSSNEVQAVAILQVGDQSIWCAVSRYDKSLSLYCLSIKDGMYLENLTSTTKIAPTTVHKTTKRSCCMTFASVPAGGSSSSLNVIVAGDLTGDATAFPLQKNDETKDDKMQGRLLLGHTASMLTGVKVVTDGTGKMRILTSDRDEKVRISQFPNTNIVEGYLLGHSAFISAMDAATNLDCSNCVTCSGDGTIRLWNYESAQEVAVAKAVADKPEQDDEGESLLIPSGVAISPDGAHVAVIYDKHLEVKIFMASGKDLKLYQTIDCPHQPLGVKFSSTKDLLVLAKEPNYVMAYTVVSGEKDLFGLTDNESCLALREIAEKDTISMPLSILESDPKSGKLKVLKEKEERGGHTPWNDAHRLEIAKQANYRRQKRKRERRREEKALAEGGSDDEY